MLNNKKIDFGIKAFIIYEGNFLVMHNKGEEKDLWELPGGRMKFGETAKKTVVRELMEETGLVIEPLKILDTWDHIEENYQITGIIYLCSLKEGTVRLSDEHDDYRWLPVRSSSVNYMYDAFKKSMINWEWNKFEEVVCSADLIG